MRMLKATLDPCRYAIETDVNVTRKMSDLTLDASGTFSRQFPGIYERGYKDVRPYICVMPHFTQQFKLAFFPMAKLGRVHNTSQRSVTHVYITAVTL
jgi:hypothetical protein